MIRRGFPRLALCTVLFACSGQDADEPRAQPGGTWSLSGEPITVIGVLDGEPEYLFEDVVDGAFLPDGRVAVADRGPGVIRIYDPNGTFERALGRSGEGPGEFNRLGALAVVPPDTLLAYDWRSQRLTLFRADGDLIEVDGITASAGFPELFLGRFEDGGVAVGWIDQLAGRADEVAPDIVQLARFSTESGEMTLLGTTNGLRRYRSEAGSGPVPFSPFLHAQVHGDSLYFTDGLRPEITVMDRDGNIARTIPTPSSPIAPAEARATLEAELAARGEERRLDQLGMVPRSDSIPHVADMFLDDQGLVWGKVFEPQRDAIWLGGGARGRGGEWWIIERDGSVVSHLEVPDGVIPLDVAAGRLLGMRTDELGFVQVVIHRIRT